MNKVMTERIYLSDDKRVYLDSLCLESYEGLPLRKAMIVFPGGGYSHLAAHEGDLTASRYFANDFNVFTLHYSTADGREKMCTDDGIPYPLIDASRAVAHVRKNAAHYGIAPDKICIMGYSAGGHLAACMATGWHEKALCDAAGITHGENRPNAALLCYAVISPDAGECFDKCMRNLFKGISDEKIKEHSEKYIPCRMVSENTCPIFIMQTATDTTVLPENAYLMSEALFAAHLPHELYVLPHAPHGCGIFDEDTRFVGQRWYKYNRSWVEQSIKWLTYLFGEN